MTREEAVAKIIKHIPHLEFHKEWQADPTNLNLFKSRFDAYQAAVLQDEELSKLTAQYKKRTEHLYYDITGLDNALIASEEYAEKETELIAERGAIPTEGVERVEAFLPDGVDNVQLILDLNTLASRSGLSLSDFDIADTKSNDQDPQQITLTSEEAVDSLELSMSAVGTYNAFKTFLEATELSLRPLDLVDLRIENSQTGIYTYLITYRIYWLAAK